MSYARVTATVYNDTLADPLFAHSDRMSTDLPATQLGELVAGAMQQAWKSGYDPVNIKVLITFA